MRPIAMNLLLPALALTLTGACDETPSTSDASPDTPAVTAHTPTPAQPASEPEIQPENGPESEPPAQPDSDAEAQPSEEAPEATDTQPRVRKSRVVRRFEMEAEGLEPLLETEAAREFIDQVSLLHNVPIRRIYVRQATVPEAVAEAEYHLLPDEIKSALRPVEIDTTKYYQTIYGSPLGYARPLDLVAARAGWESFEGKKILDFGYGQIGQLRMLAQCGADVTGIESSSMISAMYTLPGDTGEFTGTTGKTGSLSLYQGYWPAGQFARENVGAGYDLVMARSVLRKGPMDLENPDVRPELRVRLRVTPELYIARLNEILNPGGYAVVYNIGGAGPELWDQFPASDFSCPFTREQWESAGFEVIADNTMDSEPARDVGKALFLDRGPNGISLETQMYACYTLVKKVGEATIPGQAAPPESD